MIKRWRCHGCKTTARTRAEARGFLVMDIDRQRPGRWVAHGLCNACSGDMTKVEAARRSK